MHYYILSQYVYCLYCKKLIKKREIKQANIYIEILNKKNNL